MDTNDRQYVLVQDFEPRWTTDDLWLGTFINNPNAPTVLVPTSQPILEGRFPAIKRDPPFPHSPLVINAEYRKNTDSIWHIEKTVITQTFDSNFIQTIEFETTPSQHTICSRLDRHEVCQALFGRTPSDWNKVLPVYMITGVKIARSLGYRQETKNYDRLSMEPRDVGIFPTLFEDRLVDTQQTSGRFGNKQNAVIAYKLQEITQGRDGELRCDKYIDLKRVLPNDR